MTGVPIEVPRDWPGEDRRRPRRSSATWVVRSALTGWLQPEAAANAARLGRPYRVLDVGCGPKPYLPFFAPHATEYVGVDLPGNPIADLEGGVEALPVADASFDLVLCTQVLEHCDDPAAAVRELRRVVAPGGVVLASTHGVQVYHPSPQDLWRWTHEGLRRLFETGAEWESLTILPGAGSASCLAMLLGTYVEIGLRRVRARPLARGPVWAVNMLGGALDRRVSLLREPRPGSLVANLHVTAIAPGG
jgi:SAM-dependent methyltransferase